jgi:hypothetical protein
VIYSEGDIEDPYEHLRTGKWSLFFLFAYVLTGIWKMWTHEIYRKYLDEIVFSFTSAAEVLHTTKTEILL